MNHHGKTLLTLALVILPVCDGETNQILEKSPFEHYNKKTSQGNSDSTGGSTTIQWLEGQKDLIIDDLNTTGKTDAEKESALEDQFLGFFKDSGLDMNPVDGDTAKDVVESAVSSALGDAAAEKFKKNVEGKIGDDLHAADNSYRCKCTVYGDPHVYTFDGQLFTLRKPGKYKMAAVELPEEKNCSYNIVMEAEERRNYVHYRLPYAKRVRIEMNGVSATLTRTQEYTIDGDDEEAKKDLVVIKTTDHLRFHNTKCKVNVKFYEDQGVVELATDYVGQLTGFCGNCDGLKNDKTDNFVALP